MTLVGMLAKDRTEICEEDLTLKVPFCLLDYISYRYNIIYIFEAIL